jgi:hypothetical protein
MQYSRPMIASQLGHTFSPFRISPRRFTVLSIHSLWALLAEISVLRYILGASSIICTPRWWSITEEGSVIVHFLLWTSALIT